MANIKDICVSEKSVSPDSVISQDRKHMVANLQRRNNFWAMNAKKCFFFFCSSWWCLCISLCLQLGHCVYPILLYFLLCLSCVYTALYGILFGVIRIGIVEIAYLSTLRE